MFFPEESMCNIFFNKIIGLKEEKSEESIISMLKRKKVLCRTYYESIKTNLDFELTTHEIRHLKKYFGILVEQL